MLVAVPMHFQLRREHRMRATREALQDGVVLRLTLAPTVTPMAVLEQGGVVNRRHTFHLRQLAKCSRPTILGILAQAPAHGDRLRLHTIAALRRPQEEVLQPGALKVQQPLRQHHTHQHRLLLLRRPMHQRLLPLFKTVHGIRLNLRQHRQLRLHLIKRRPRQLPMPGVSLVAGPSTDLQDSHPIELSGPLCGD